MIDLSSHLGLVRLDLALGFVQHAALIEFLVNAAPRRHLQDHFTPVILGTLLAAGITRIGADQILLAMQQLIDLSAIRYICCCAHHALYQSRLVIHADVRLHTEIVLVNLLGLVHLRVALTLIVLGRTRRIDQRGIDDGALAQ